MINSNQILGSHSWWRQVVISVHQSRVLRPRFLILILVCACGFTLPACSSSPTPLASNPGSTDARTTAFTTPPFSTKEPDRYQAIRIISTTETANSENVSTSQVLIARDGEKRREEYSAGATEKIVHLEIPAGRFIVLPANRIYAELSAASQEADPGKGFLGSADSPELSPDQLLNEAHAPASYEKMGTETIAGRTTTKYRVVVQAGTDSQNETLIWIDEALGIPVRSETMSKSIGHSSKMTMELKDIKLEVDASLFSWPTDYRKVEARVIFDLARNGKPAPKRGDK